MADLPADQVRAELAPLWDRLRAGTLSVSAAGAAAMTPATLARYRLRPVPWGRLAVLAAGWLPAHPAPGGPARRPDMGVTVFRWAALLLGLGGAVLAAPETDPPRAVLRAEPVPLWRTLALRLAGWLALGAAPILALAVLLDGLAGWTAADLTTGTLPGFRLATAVRIPGRRPDLGPGRRRRRHGRGGRAVHSRAGLAGLVPGPALQRPRRPTLAVQPGLDGRAQPGPGGGGAGWPSAAPSARRASPAPPDRPARPRVRGQAPAMMGVGRRGLGRGWHGPRAGLTGAASDDELVAAVAAGDRRALELLYRRHAPWLAGRLAATDLVPGPGRGGPPGHLPGRLAQRPRLPRPGEVPAWLWGIARRRLASLARRQPRGSLSLEVAGERVDPASGPEEAALGQDTSARIRPPSPTSPPSSERPSPPSSTRARPSTQAALAAKVAEGTIKSRLHRARLQIRTELQP